MLDQRSAALPAGVSASGAVVVGSFGEGGGFYWMPTTGAVHWRRGRRKREPGWPDHRRKGDRSRVIQAAIWLRAAEWKVLGSFRPAAAPCDASLSGAQGTSGDGRVVVGLAWMVATSRMRSGGRIDGHGGPREFRRGTFQSRDRRFRRRQSRGRLPDGRERVRPGRAMGGRSAGTLSRSRGFVGTANAANSDGTVVVGRSAPRQH